MADSALTELNTKPQFNKSTATRDRNVMRVGHRWHQLELNLTGTDVLSQQSSHMTESDRAASATPSCSNRPHFASPVVRCQIDENLGILDESADSFS
jgi:hypothetical protein